MGVSASVQGEGNADMRSMIKRSSSATWRKAYEGRVMFRIFSISVEAES